MKYNHSPKSIAYLLACTMALGILAPTAAEAEQKPFKIQIEQNDRLRDNGTTLNRQDIKKGNQDPFAGDDNGGDALDVPDSMFKADKPLVPAKPKPFPLNAQQDQMAAPPPQLRQAPARMAPMMPQDMEGMPAMMPPRQPPAPPAFNPNDPDQSPDMLLAWDAWHKRVAGAIYDRFNFFAKAAFRHSPPLGALLTYQVTRDGHIINMNMTQKSSNVLFNVLVYQCVKSLEGDLSILAFPQGSRRSVVAKAGQFTQNIGGQEGFRYITGDKEKISANR